MGHLHINGYRVLTRQGYNVTYPEVAVHRQYSSNGQFQFARNAIGRQWKFQSIPLPKSESQALAALVSMQGDHWGFGVDSADRPIATAASNFYSDKKRDATTLVGSAVSCFAADGALIYDRNGVADRPFEGPTGNLLCEPGTTNLLSINNANPTTNGHLTNVIGGTHAADSNRYWTGSASVAVTMTNSGDGVETAAVGSLSNATRYVFSVYVRPQAGGETIDLEIEEIGGSAPGTSTSSTLVLVSSTDAWQRFELARTTGATAGTLTCRVTQVGSGPYTVNVAGLQLEAQTQNATTWEAGQTTRATGDLQYRNLLTGYTQGITATFWVKSLNLGFSTTHIGIDTGVTTTGSRFFLGTTSNDKWSFQLQAADLGGISSLGAVDPFATDEAWHMITAVYDPSVPGVYLYEDGVLLASDISLSGNRLFDASAITGDLHFGNLATGGAAYGPGPITNLAIYPFAAPAAFVSGLYNSALGYGGGAPGLVPLTASGDFLGVGEASIPVIGRVTKVQNLPIHDPTNGWESGAAVVDFTLTEVTAK